MGSVCSLENNGNIKTFIEPNKVHYKLNNFVAPASRQTAHQFELLIKFHIKISKAHRRIVTCT